MDDSIKADGHYDERQKHAGQNITGSAKKESVQNSMGMLQNQAEQICNTDAEQDIQKGAKPVITKAFDKRLRPGCRQ